MRSNIQTCLCYIYLFKIFWLSKVQCIFVTGYRLWLSFLETFFIWKKKRKSSAAYFPSFQASKNNFWNSVFLHLKLFWQNVCPWCFLLLLPLRVGLPQRPSRVFFQIINMQRKPQTNKKRLQSVRQPVWMRLINWENKCRRKQPATSSAFP